MLWSNPLVRIVLKPVNVDDEPLPIQHLILTDLALPSYLMDGAEADTWVYAEDLIYYVAEVVAGTQ